VLVNWLRNVDDIRQKLMGLAVGPEKRPAIYSHRAAAELVQCLPLLFCRLRRGTSMFRGCTPEELHKWVSARWAVGNAQELLLIQLRGSGSSGGSTVTARQREVPS
jgi:hypothetical protein